MKKTDDQMVERYLKSRKQHVPDDGFLLRVHEHLTEMPAWRSLVWPVLVWVMAVSGFFIWFDGFYIVSCYIREIFISMVQTFATTQLDWKVYIVALGALLIIGIHKLTTRLLE